MSTSSRSGKAPAADRGCKEFDNGRDLGVSGVTDPGKVSARLRGRVVTGQGQKGRETGVAAEAGRGGHFKFLIIH